LWTASTRLTPTAVTVITEGFDPSVIATFQNGIQIDTVFDGTTVVLSVAGVPDGLDVTYEWEGNLQPATGNGPTITVTVPFGDSAPASLDYTVFINTVEGACEFMVDIVLPVTRSKFEIPELITPNGDDVNDVFRVYFGGQITDYNMAVYNRWGQQVFSSSDVDEAWDGTKNGTPQNSDLYLYVTRFRINGVEVTREGQFNLVR